LKIFLIFFSTKKKPCENVFSKFDSALTHFLNNELIIDISNKTLKTSKYARLSRFGFEYDDNDEDYDEENEELSLKDKAKLFLNNEHENDFQDDLSEFNLHQNNDFTDLFEMSIWNEKRFPRIFKVFFFLLISLNDD
jgi:hypothetical protein